MPIGAAHEALLMIGRRRLEVSIREGQWLQIGSSSNS